MPIFEEEKMKDKEKTKAQLINELLELRKQVSQLKEAEAKHKEAKERIKESEKRFRDTLDNMMEGCQIIGYDWRYLYVNDAVATHGRTTREKLLGKTMMEAYPGIEKTKMFATLQRCMKKRTSTYMENEFEYPDGEKRWFELSIQSVPEGIFILSIDITERKQAEEALKASEAKYHTLFEEVPVGLYRTTPDGRVLDVNLAMIQMLGYPDRKSLLETNAKDLYVKSEDRKQLKKALEDKGVLEKFEHRLRRYDGKTIWMLDTARAVFDANRQVLFYEGSLQDINDRKQAEEELYQINRELKMLSECNQSLVRTNEETDLLNEICQIIVEAGEYRMAWVGFAEQDKKKTVHPAAQVGFEESYLEKANITWAGAYWESNPFRQAQYRKKYPH
jgi:PAS domain S-box-containing protein